MKNYILFLLVLGFLNVKGQNNDSILKKESLTKIKNDSLKFFVENLKRDILNDTLRFNKIDLIAVNGQTKNSKQYSKMYLVDMKYLYRLDIIDNQKVKEFVEEILDIGKIETISISENNSCCSVFGKNGTNGCVFITTKYKSKLKYKVAGLKYYRKSKMGMNLNQNEKEGLMIRN